MHNFGEHHLMPDYKPLRPTKPRNSYKVSGSVPLTHYYLCAKDLQERGLLASQSMGEVLRALVHIYANTIAVNAGKTLEEITPSTSHTMQGMTSLGYSLKQFQSHDRHSVPLIKDLIDEERQQEEEQNHV